MLKFINKKTIRLGKELNNLDIFVLDFVAVLERHTDYAIVSGYTALLFGRSRATEDVDMLVPEMDEKHFKNLFNDLEDSGFWCLNSDNANVLYNDYLKQKTAIRLARKNKVIPNIELKFAKNDFDCNTIRERIKVITRKGDIFIGPLEEEIAFKEIVLGSEKDMEDAGFLRNLFKGSLDKKRIEGFKKLLSK